MAIINRKELQDSERKRIMLNILNEIDSFCRGNDIKYFLVFGSLLGAVRHKGYIPWDDDIDIGMLRSDYDRFLEIYRPQKAIYRLYKPEIDNDYIYAFAKLCDERTILIEDIDDKNTLGVYIDIFPFDNAGNSLSDAVGLAKRIKVYKCILDIKNTLRRKDRSLLKNTVLTLFKFLLSFLSKKMLISQIIKLSKKYKYSSSKLVAEFSIMAYGNKEIYPKDLFTDLSELTFENRQYYVPKDYDKFLSLTYGNYMQLPPVEKRVTHHSNKAYWKQ